MSQGLIKLHCRYPEIWEREKPALNWTSYLIFWSFFLLCIKLERLELGFFLKVTIGRALSFLKAWYLQRWVVLTGRFSVCWKCSGTMGIEGFFLEPLSCSGHSSLTNIDPGDYGRRWLTIFPHQLPMLYVTYFFLAAIYS